MKGEVKAVWSVHCGPCPQWVASALTKADARAVAREKGWRLTRARGWVCPECVTPKEVAPMIERTGMPAVGIIVRRVSWADGVRRRRWAPHFEGEDGGPGELACGCYHLQIGTANRCAQQLGRRHGLPVEEMS